MSVSSIVTHRVSDFDAWHEVYKSVEGVQKAGGVRSERVLRGVDDPQMVVVEHVFDDADTAHAFFDNAELRQAMADGGVDLESLQLTFAEPV